MTIEDKLTTIANNVPLVYKAGYDRGKAECDDSTLFGNMNSINYFFVNGLNPYYLDKFKDLEFSNLYAAQYVFMDNKNVTSIITPVFPNTLALIHGMFMRCTNLKTVDMSADMFTARVSVVTDLFNGCTALEEVIGELDFSKSTYASKTFQGCSSLKEIRFAENSIAISISFADSPLLTSESVQSIIDALATVTEAKAITFNEGITLTDTQIAEIDGKGWDLVQ